MCAAQPQIAQGFLVSRCGRATAIAACHAAHARLWLDQPPLPRHSLPHTQVYVRRAWVMLLLRFPVAV